MSLSNPLLSVFSKSMVLLAISTSMFGLSINANAGFLDSIYEVQNTIGSIGRTAKTFRGSKQAVSELGEEVGLTDLMAQNNQSNTGRLTSGSILSGRLQSTKLYSQPNKSSNPIAILSQQDVMIYMGTEQNGYYHVESDKGEGWVSKPLISIQ